MLFPLLYKGTISLRGYLLITTPAACMLVCLFKFSNFLEISISFIYSLLLLIKSTKDLFFLRSSKVSLSFMNLHILSISLISKFNTLPTSLIACLGKSDPKVIIFALLSSPYFFLTYSITSSLLASDKSTSMSGIVTLSGFKNLSNIKLYFIGSMLVIPRQ